MYHKIITDILTVDMIYVQSHKYVEYVCLQ